MTLPRTVTGWLLLGLLGGALGQGCGASSKTHNPAASGPGAGSGGKDNGSMIVEPPGVSGAAGESPYDPLCGILAGSCVPDEESNSMCVARSSGTGGGAGHATSSSGGTGGSSKGTGGSSNGTGGSSNGTGGSPSASGTAGQVAGTAGTSSPSGGRGGLGPIVNGGEGGEAPAAGASEGGGNGAGAPGANGGEGGLQSSEGGAGQQGLGGEGVAAEAGTGTSTGAMGGSRSSTGGASAGRSSGGATSSGVSCQVTENAKHKGSPVAVCGPAGTGTEGSPCFSGEDCAPSYACVGDGPGQCRAYCCSGASQCTLHPGTHCAVEPLVLPQQSSRVFEVPVCMPPVKCNLAEPYPCPPNVTCSCPSDSACVVVGDDGTTSCLPVSELPPVDDTMGDDTAGPCPCAHGYVCSQTNVCVKLCEVATPDGCKSLRCQASASLPTGWGTCIGTAQSGG